MARSFVVCSVIAESGTTFIDIRNKNKPLGLGPFYEGSVIILPSNLAKFLEKEKLVWIISKV